MEWSKVMVYDFHTHSLLSDGGLSPIELVRRAQVAGYRAIAITDHAGFGSLKRIISEVADDCARAREHWGITAIPGIELTHLPPQAIAEAAQMAKELGAWLVVVHGETIIEPVEKGSNLAAVTCPQVDILAHPGLLTLEEAQLAGANGIFIEISARKGHSLTNGHVLKVAREAGCQLLLGSDAHEAEELLSATLASEVVRGAGLDQSEAAQVLEASPQLLLKRLSSKLPFAIPVRPPGE
ncbi:MAG: histidinol phosphate phosphatase domain-containing protein [Dehalococcoidia bacterium]